MSQNPDISTLEQAIKNRLIPEIRAEIEAALESKAASPAQRWIKGIAAASKIAALHKDTLRELLRDGEIRGYQTDGGTWIIDRQSLDEYHEKRIREQTSEKELLRQKIVASRKKTR